MSESLSRRPSGSLHIVIPVHNRRLTTLACLHRIARCQTGDADVRCIVVDDGSTDGTSESVLASFPQVTLVRGDGDLWWAGAVNRGIEVALSQGAYTILILNDDVEFAEDFLAILLAYSEEFPGAVLGPAVHYRDRPEELLGAGGVARGRILLRLSHIGEHEPSEIWAHSPPRPVDWLPGFALLVPVEVIRRFGLFAAADLPQYHGDLEFTLRVSCGGGSVLACPRARIYTDRNKKYFKFSIQKDSLSTIFTNLFSTASHYALPTKWRLFRACLSPAAAPLSLLWHAGGMLGMIAVRTVAPRSLFRFLVARRYGTGALMDLEDHPRAAR